MWSLLLAFAVAAPVPAPVRDEDFLHTIEVPKSARFQKVEGRPVRARLRGSGAYEAWVWRDGRVARYRQWDGKRLVEDARFDAFGDRLVTVRYADDTPTVAIGHGRSDVAVDLAGWHTETFGAADLIVPAITHRTDGSLQAWPGGGEWRAAWGPVGDPFTEAFQDGLAATCACEVVDRYTVFADGRAGAGYLVRIPGPDVPRLGEIAAFPDPSGTLLVAYTAPTGYEPVGIDDPGVRLAAGRTIVALLTWSKR